MNKTVKNSLIVIGIVIVLFMIIWFAYDMIKAKPVDANTIYTNLEDGNTGLDNIINELFDNVIIEQDKNSLEDENAKEEEKANNEATVSTSENMTSKQEKAIALVKKEWGGEDGVYFSNESIDSKGRYIVSVRDSRTTNSLAFFLVDVDKELVTKQ